VPTLERQVKQYLKEKYHKPGNVYLGIPHRLDRPASGVMVFARNSKAAARLAEQFRERQVKKIYWALVERPLDPPDGELVDWLLKVPGQACVSVVPPETPGAREARLKYRTLQFTTSNSQFSVYDRTTERPPPAPPGEEDETRRTLLEVELLTGRTHQIRVQLAARGWPIVGDGQYGAVTRLVEPPPPDPRDEPIALHARNLTILHPVRYDALTITAPVPANWSTSTRQAFARGNES
jgi:23S rRNA pseudouridine1911/1915/1917 synthase